MEELMVTGRREKDPREVDSNGVAPFTLWKKGGIPKNRVGGNALLMEQIIEKTLALRWRSWDGESETNHISIRTIKKGGTSPVSNQDDRYVPKRVEEKNGKCRKAD